MNLFNFFKTKESPPHEKPVCNHIIDETFTVEQFDPETMITAPLFCYDCRGMFVQILSRGPSYEPGKVVSQSTFEKCEILQESYRKYSEVRKKQERGILEHCLLEDYLKRKANKPNEQPTL